MALLFLYSAVRPCAQASCAAHRVKYCADERIKVEMAMKWEKSNTYEREIQDFETLIFKFSFMLKEISCRMQASGISVKVLYKTSS